MTTRVIQVTGKRQLAAAAAEGAAAIQAGGLVGFPTETVYGVAALASDVSAMARLRELKSRPERPFSVHLGGKDQADRYASPMPPSARRLIEKAWPGPVTLVVPTGDGLPDGELERAGLRKVLCKDGLIGLRCPDEPIALAMLSAVSGPVVAPSANLAGAPSPTTAEQVLASLDGRIDLLIDGGPTRFRQDSTIVQCDRQGWKVLRQGVYDASAIERLIRLRLLFVCTGNTCRSPIAAGLARKMLAERLGCGVDELGRHGAEVLSAGVVAGAGRGAAPEAVRAARQLGADIRRHRSQKLTAELINSADLIFCMADVHVETVRRMVPQAQGKVVRLDALGDVSDPIGGGGEVYARVAEQISQALQARFEKELP